MTTGLTNQYENNRSKKKLLTYHIETYAPVATFSLVTVLSHWICFDLSLEVGGLDYGNSCKCKVSYKSAIKC